MNWLTTSIAPRGAATPNDALRETVNAFLDGNVQRLVELAPPGELSVLHDVGPVLGDLGRWPLMIGSVILTAFNDNAAITYLATLVPGFTEELKFAVVAGAIAGGGLTVIANAPNPAGQSILQSQFEDGGISPLKLFLGALVPTIIVGLAFMLLPSIASAFSAQGGFQ